MEYIKYSKQLLDYGHIVKRSGLLDRYSHEARMGHF